MAEQPTLQAEGLVLRPWALPDAAALHAIKNSTDVERFTPLVLPFGMERAVDWVTVFAPGQWAKGRHGEWAVTSTEDEVLGTVCLFALDGQRLEAGVITLDSARGRGVARRAAAAVVRFAFDAGWGEQVEWHVSLANEPSKAVAVRAGFEPVGVVPDLLAPGVDGWRAVARRGDGRAAAPDQT